MFYDFAKSRLEVPIRFKLYITVNVHQLHSLRLENRLFNFLTVWRKRLTKGGQNWSSLHICNNLTETLTHEPERSNSRNALNRYNKHTTKYRGIYKLVFQIWTIYKKNFGKYVQIGFNIPSRSPGQILFIFFSWINNSVCDFVMLIYMDLINKINWAGLCCNY